MLPRRQRIALALALAALALGVVVWWQRRGMVRVTSRINGRQYLVKRLPLREQVADTLAEMELRVRRFLVAAEAAYPDDVRLANIRRRWNGTLSETPDHAKDIAYSVGKDAVFVCVRTADGAGVEDMNTCMFVLLHELAHVATSDWGHPPVFWSNMRWLLEVAESTGHYVYQDFESTKTTYCGRRLGGNPLTCLKHGACRSEVSPAIAAALGK